MRVWSDVVLLVLVVVAREASGSPASAESQTALRMAAGVAWAHGEWGMDDGRGWIDPRLGGGQMLDFTTKTRGEPLNIIISGASDPFILTDEGFTAYVNSIGYAPECMGLHFGNIHLADLGDGDGRKPEGLLFRQHYRVPGWGTCWESLAGGQHFRAWKQNGTAGDSGAWFLGASKEEDASRHHTIVANGYNLGRDWFVEQALAASESQRSAWVPYGDLGPRAIRDLIRSQPLWPAAARVEKRGWLWPSTGERLRWRAEVEWVWGLLPPGRKGVNHNIAQDGRVAVLTIHRVPPPDDAI
ncbi:hypothetical protein HMN09_00982200 [Mycena chlorophos]|uniref:Uncharacterized protein n=1 Tax=Mycena chlorophos TaxID=658473 RepID=A0A8H6W2Y1_MYCCL|nr:hypothetical protein HMN09_00982200 [Mycena chlorophos]